MSDTPLAIIVGDYADNLHIELSYTSDLTTLSTFQYKLNDAQEWSVFSAGLDLSSEDTVLFRNLSDSLNKSTDSFYRFNITGAGDISISGSLAALNNFDTKNVKSFQFARLFEGNDNIVSVSGLSCQFLDLATHCYERMFADCINLEDVPTGLLPASGLANKCYKEMFQNCISLTSIPVLTAATLVPYCYEKMFEGCEWIPSAALTGVVDLAQGCYRDMFYKCSNLTSLEVDFTDWKSFKNTDLWLSDGAFFGTFIKPEKLDDKIGKIPQNWILIDKVEEQEEQP